jgi:hypothetical protein
MLLSFGVLSVFFRAVARWGWDQFFFSWTLEAVALPLVCALGVARGGVKLSSKVSI